MANEIDRIIDLALNEPRVQVGGAAVGAFIGISAHNFAGRLHENKLNCTQKEAKMDRPPSVELSQQVQQELELMPESVPAHIRGQYKNFLTLVQSRQQKWVDAKEVCTAQIDPGNFEEFSAEVVAFSGGAISLILMLALGYNQVWRRFVRNGK